MTRSFVGSFGAAVSLLLRSQVACGASDEGNASAAEKPLMPWSSMPTTGGTTRFALPEPLVKTPVLDDLAKNGVRFTQNCVTTSICEISRGLLFTGSGCFDMAIDRSSHGTRLESKPTRASCVTMDAMSENGTTDESRRISSISDGLTTASSGSRT